METEDESSVSSQRGEEAMQLIAIRRSVVLALLVFAAGAAKSGMGRADSVITSVPGPVPTNCGAGSLSVGLHDAYGDGKTIGGFFGAAPVWGLGLIGPHGVLHLGLYNDGPEIYQQPYGWGRKIFWVLQPRFTGTARVTGGSVTGATPLWFDATENNVPVTPQRVLILRAKNQKAFTGNPHAWPSFPGGLYVPKAGCYYIEAHWPGGHWRLTFAAGN